MRAALDAAAAAHRRTSPNPRVGAVVVVDGRMVGSGATQPPGGAHAERVALAEAGPAAAGATLYTTLEPCDHEGRTAPCTDAIIGAGVARVVVGIGDPDPEVSGRGIGRLREAGLDDVPVIVGGIIPESDGRRLVELGVAAVYTPKDFGLTEIMGGIVEVIRRANGLA